ncbi:MAG TPA: hypothetical protein VD969_14305 [Symbiobacteriaceae bacterium]|nr:hypothetical protein [Symbiobacteriaceae bacterium]
MSGILSGYTVMQQAEWAGRRFFTAQDRRTGQVVHLVAGPVTDALAPYQHPSLPPLQPVAVESDTRWLVGPVTEGETLEDLRTGNQLSESDLVSALLSVLEGLASLTALPSPPAPSYLDPACIKRDRLGRWSLDYLALAHAPEARSAANPPYGVHAFGVLLYWLITGQTVRRSRIQLNRMENGISPGLQFVLIRCLSKSYPSLSELRADIERSGQEHEFRQILNKPPSAATRSVPTPRPIRLPPQQPEPAPAPERSSTEHLLTHIPVIPLDLEAPSRRLAELERHRITLGGPQIPMSDRPWALPPRPSEGYRKYVVPPPPNPKVVKAIRFGSLGLVSLATFFLASAVVIKAGLIPSELLPEAWRNERTAARMPNYAEPGAQIGEDLPPESEGPIAGPVLPDPPLQQKPSPEENEATEPPVPPPSSPPAATNPTPPPPKNPPPPISAPANPVKPAPTQPVPIPPPKPAPPSQQEQPPTEAKPIRKEPEPGTPDYLDATQGGLPVQVFFNNRRLGWAYIFPHPASPYVSISTFNRLFGRNLYWVPQDGGSIRLLNGGQNIITGDYNIVQERLWLNLTPFLQEALGIQVKSYNEYGMHFSSMP